MKNSTKRLVAGALMAALCCLATAFTKVPIGLGYVHVGDMMVFLCAFLPGGWIGAVAAGLGSALADLIAGYPDFILPTFVIKALMASAVILIASKRNPIGMRTIIGMVVGSIIMIGGYFAYELLRLGLAQAAFLTAIIGNLLQAGFGIISSYIILVALTKTGLIKRYQNK